MKHTTADALLSRELLCFVHDQNPTVEAFLARFGDVGGQVFHVLRKEGVIVEEDGRVRLSRRHLSPDGQQFYWGFRIFWLDRNEVWSCVWKRGEGPPVFSDAP